jgi:MATE family multidrug resistance protein
MAVSFAVFVAASWALLGLYGNHGLWAAMLIFMATRGVTLARFLPGVVRGVARVAA